MVIDTITSSSPPAKPRQFRHLCDGAEEYFNEHPLRYEKEIDEYLSTWGADILYQLEHETGAGLARALECHRISWINRLEKIAAREGGAA